MAAGPLRPSPARHHPRADPGQDPPLAGAPLRTRPRRTGLPHSGAGRVAADRAQERPARRSPQATRQDAQEGRGGPRRADRRGAAAPHAGLRRGRRSDPGGGRRLCGRRDRHRVRHADLAQGRASAEERPGTGPPEPARAGQGGARAGAPGGRPTPDTRPRLGGRLRRGRRPPLRLVACRTRPAPARPDRRT